MLIDFHTHAFPDALAPRAIESLMRKGKMMPFFDGTVDGLIHKMDLFGVDKSVLLNIATNPKQQENVNKFADEINTKYERVISFGSVNPYSEHPYEDTVELCKRGFKGIKLHPDYMGVPADSEKFFPIYKACAEFGLITVLHSGYDFISPDFIHTTPDRVLKVKENFPSLKIVCAHMGGNRMWRDVLKKLCGKDIYFDTSLCAYELERDMAEQIIKNHGEDKILFGTDMPWCSPIFTKSFIDSLDITDELKENIFHKNAEKLLGI